jgi:hypothetical protein
MRKLILGIAFIVPLTLATPASALPGASHDPLLRDAIAVPDIIEVKRGGRGHGWGRGGGHRAFGWSRGRKVGWRGRGCPPGLWKQGRC